MSSALGLHQIGAETSPIPRPLPTRQVVFRYTLRISHVIQGEEGHMCNS